jgi:N-terminal acetyltransferase B complex non-catalytic subunit
MLYLVRAAFSLAASSSSSYFDTSSTAPSSPVSPSEAGLELISKSRERFRSLAKDSPKSKVERGFLLGSLEIAREVKERGWDEGECLLRFVSSGELTTSSSAVDSLAALVREYFDRFSTKMCCFDDLYPYLDVLSASEASTLRDQVAKEAASATLKVRPSFAPSPASADCPFESRPSPTLLAASTPSRLHGC